MAFFFSKLKLYYLNIAWLPQNFVLDTKGTCQVLLSPHSFKPRKNIPVLVGTTHRKVVTEKYVVVLGGTVLNLGESYDLF